MGLLIQGVWHEVEPHSDTGGKFVRKDAMFRNWITADGRPGPTGKGGYAAEAGRYHLYVSLACPWAHRTLIFRELKGLQPAIPVSVTHWVMGKRGWSFEPGPGVIQDTVNHTSFVHELYALADPDCSTRATVPVLWDTHSSSIVSNESSDIIRMFNTAFDDLGATPGDYFPLPLREDIETVNARIYDTLNNGVYKSGFASTQQAYEEAVLALFDTLDWLEARLADHRYLMGEQITEADWRLFTTLVRFDVVYAGHFKCNVRRIVDYPNLWAYTRELYQWPGVAATVDFDHIKRHYYMSHAHINPSAIVPVGPVLDFLAPHGREGVSAR